MKFTDLNNNSQNTYAIASPEKHVFFLYNQSKNIIFDITTPDAEVYVFALFVGKEQDDFTLSIQQHHTAPKTISHVTVKSILKDESKFRYEGSIIIEKVAQKSEASQTNRNLLLSSNAQAFSQPNLEILADDVLCHHGATTSQLNPDHLFYAQSRGLTQEQAQDILAQGFINDFFNEIEKIGKFEEIAKYKEFLTE